MISRKIVTSLVVGFAVLMVAFAVLMGAYAIAAAVGDTFGAIFLWRAAMGVAILFVTTTLLLIACLGMIEIERNGTCQKPVNEESPSDFE